MNSGSGLADVQGIEVGRIKEIVDTKADSFADLSKVRRRRVGLLEAKQATTPGGAVIGAGTDIGPMSLCYNRELFEKAGLPTDRAEVAKRTAGGWEDFLALGEEYKKKAPKGTYFMDSASAMFNAVVSSSPEQYYDASGKPVYKESAGVKKGWDLAAEAASKKLTQGLAQFEDQWQAALRKSTVATVVCPAWMAGQISTYAGDANKGKWDITSAPGGVSANWGGSFLAVPKSGKNVDEATKLVEVADRARAAGRRLQGDRGLPVQPGRVRAARREERHPAVLQRRPHRPDLRGRREVHPRGGARPEGRRDQGLDLHADQQHGAARYEAGRGLGRRGPHDRQGDRLT